MSPRNRLVVLAGPTAVGKGTVAAAVRERHPAVWISVSATTRTPRPGEVDGVHYHFVDDAEFDRMVDDGELLEWAVNHGVAKYGTPRAPVEAALPRRDTSCCWRSTSRAPGRCGSRCPTRCSSS